MRTTDMRTTTLKKLQNNRETHDKLQKLHTDFWRRLQCWAGTRMRNWMYKCWQTRTQRRKQERWLDETLADVTQFYSTQHDVQKDSWETNDLQILIRKREVKRLLDNQEKIPEIQQRCRSQRQDPHGQWPQICHGNLSWSPLRRRMATVELKKTSPRQHNTTEGIKLKKNIGDEKRELDNGYQEHIEEINEKAEAKNRRNKKAAAQAKSERTEAEAKEADGEFSEIEVRKDVKTVRKRWRTSWTSHASERWGRFYRATCRTRHERESKERQIEWSRLSPGWDHDGIQAWRNKWSSSSKKDTWIQDFGRD